MDQKEIISGKETQERMEREFEENRNKLGVGRIIEELEREHEEERQKIFNELKLTRKEKAELFKMKKENVKREILILKTELDKFKEQKKLEKEYFLENLDEISEMTETDSEEDEENVLCFKPEEREEQVNEISKLLKYSFDLYSFIKRSSERITKDCRSNEEYFDTIKLLRFFDSHFDKNFEEEIKYYKEKFGY